ncbi:HupE/UreJ family protein [Flavobacterium sp. N2270]|uniref:HupE/UreJ family protein n=1 Tax=Flavobacterium sp. N2270 TaxID=2986831 RepID=UPI002224D63A|nr:HupE/UreJ family protein [Flavobacterium sp. N2270]
MSQFWLYFKLGLDHVLDIHAYDHVMFLIALMVPYAFKDWKRIFLLVSLFTLGHTLSLILSVFGTVVIAPKYVEFLIPITILITAVFHLFTAGKSSRKESISFVAVVTLFFGIIHGLGFSNYFNSILPGSAADKLLPLLEFALGIEASQIIVVFVVLVISYIAQTFFRFSKRDWALVLSAFIIGLVLPMLIENEIWNR